MVPTSAFARDIPGKVPVQRSSANGHAIPATHRMPLSSSPLAFRPRELDNETETSQKPP
jgi:hypothetical protein